MKSESFGRPNPLEIVDKGEYSEVVLTENAEQIPAAQILLQNKGETNMKNCIHRAIRTFVQTVVGFVATNLTMQISGVDIASLDILKTAVAGLTTAAIAAGIAAVMNLPMEGEK